MSKAYACPACRDSGFRFVAVHDPANANVNSTGYVFRWQPCNANPCLAPDDEDTLSLRRKDGRHALRDNLNQAAAKGAADGILGQHTPVYFVSVAR